MERFEINKAYDDFKLRLDALNNVLQIPNLCNTIIENEKIMSTETFWDDAKKATSFVQRNNEMKETIEKYNSLVNLNDELEVILQLEDETLYIEAEELIRKIKKELDRFEIEQLLNEPYDHLNAILELHPGAGGTESQDWALMLYRMYKRYTERANFDFELLDYEDAIDAGLKSVTFLVKGKNAYGILSDASVDIKIKFDISHELFEKIVYDRENDTLFITYR